MRSSIRKLLLFAAFIVAVPAMAGVVDNTTHSATLCQNVSVLNTVLAAATGTTRRVKWSIVTTSGAATIYFQEGAAATVKGPSSVPLTGGMSFTDDGPATYSGVVTAVAVSGTSWVCTQVN